MYKLLIVDDEPIERSTLGLIISKYINNIKVVGEASNGREAIAKTKELNPDIILMDIKMPGINGIEAAQEIKRWNDTVKIIIITAYDYFEYAKESFRTGVDDFLLKPVLKEKLQESLKDIVNEINAERNRKKFDENIVSKLKEFRSFIEGELISSILLRLDDSNINEYLALLDIQFAEAYGIIVSVDESEIPLYIADGVRQKVFRKRVFDKVAQKLRNIGIKLIFTTLNDWFYAIVMMDVCDSQYNQKLFSLNVSRELKEYIQKELDVNINIGIGMSYSSVKSLFNSFMEAKIALNSNTDRTEGTHFGDLDVKIHYEDYPFYEEKLLCESIVKGNADESHLSMGRLIRWIVMNSRSDTEIKQKIFEVIVIVTRAAAVFEHLEKHLLDTVKYMDDIRKMSSLNEIDSYMKRFVTQLVDGINKVRTINMNSQISKAVSYILNNYGKDITLEDVAKEVSLSPYYLSKLFKQETGENFIEYLTNHRMSVALELVKEKNLSIKDIAYKTGYNDPNYFSKLFKKYYGISPSEYEG